MSHPEGAYLGGIRTVECLRARCVVDEDTGCWHWRMAMVQGAPKVHFLAPDTGMKTHARGRRAALYLMRGKDLPAGMHAFARLQCKSDDCVNPAHTRMGTREQHGAWLRATGKHKGLPSKMAAARKRWAGKRVLTPEMVAEIRSSDLSTYKLAAKIGVAQYTIWSCRVGRSHKTEIRGASVFSWGLSA